MEFIDGRFGVAPVDPRRMSSERVCADVYANFLKPPIRPPRPLRRRAFVHTAANQALLRMGG